MKEIKFRAWDGKIMFYNVSLLWNGDVDVIHEEKAIYVRRKKLEVMQYIGVHDKKRKMIFEGDIGWNMSDEAGDTEVGNHEVVFKDGLFGIKSRIKNKVIPIRGVLFEIIGNIWENPELI